MDLFRTTFAKQTQLYVHMTIWSAKKWFGLETEFGHPILLSKCSCRPALTSHFSAPHTRQQTSSNGCFRYESKNTFTYSHHVYIVQYIWYGTEWVTTVSFHFISTTQAIFFFQLLFVYIYIIHSFGWHFYPKRLTIEMGYNWVVDD